MRKKAVVAAGSGGAGADPRRSSRRPKAVVAMSGGVDSSVAAALMVQDGYDVTGVMLKLWRGEAANNNSGCCNIDAASDARRVADALGIDFYVFNFAERFEDTVVRDFQSAYALGRTPNPCVRCNQWIKFGALMERSDALGADVLVTGHYARIRERDGRYRLLRGNDPAKDQSYVLWMLDQRALARTRLPIGEMNKTETRAIAGELGLRTATKPDSQEICFVQSGDLGSYVEQNLAGMGEGPIVDTSGKRLGEHAGIARYTVGQRKGLGISIGQPLYVTSIDAGSNAITVGSRDELAVGGIEVSEVGWVDAAPPAGTRVYLQHRAHGEVHPAQVGAGNQNAVELAYDEPAFAVAPGQSAVLYSFDDPDEVLGGGVIASTVPAVARTA
jgi:tRNA-uridine 2-sulfurtransferase